MANYYFNADATGDAGGTGEANAYDGSTSSTLPNGTVAACKLTDVIEQLGNANTLWIKQASAITPFGNASSTSSVNTTSGPTRFMDGATGHGYNEIIGYQGTTGDNLRVDIDMTTITYREDRDHSRIKNLNFIGSYSGGGVVRLGSGVRAENCRFENTRTADGGGHALHLNGGGSAYRCECIGNGVDASPSNSDCVVRMSPGDSLLQSCYVEARNGQHGIAIDRHSGNSSVISNIVNVNLDTGGAGHDSGNGIHFVSATYLNDMHVYSNIVHNANTGINFGVQSGDNRASLFVSKNIISNCVNGIVVADEINYPTSTSTTPTIQEEVYFIDNFYHNCTTSTTNCNSETNITTLASDPFVSSSTNDFTITSANASLFGYASQFYQEARGASGDTITKNALIPIQANVCTDSSVQTVGFAI